MPQFLRQAEVIFLSDDNRPLPVISGLRINFRISKTLKKEENSCSVDIYNLSKRSREQLEAGADKLELRAGYGDPGEVFTSRSPEGKLIVRKRGVLQLPSIFIGDITANHHKYVPPEGITTYECIRQKKTQSKVSVSHKAGTKISVIFKDLIKRAGVEVRSNIDDFIFDDKPLTTGYTFMGPIKDAFDELVDIIDSEWSYEDGVFKLIARDRTDRTAVIFLDKTKGLLGVPEKYKDIEKKPSRGKKSTGNPKEGYIVRSLLLANANPGGSIVLTSKQLELNQEIFKIDTVEHVGDTFGNIWGTKVKVFSVLKEDTTITTEAVAGVLV